MLKSTFYIAATLVAFLFFEQVDGVETPDVSIEIPMRDGCQLPTDIYLSDQIEQPGPCVLYRSPKGKFAPEEEITALKKAGISVAVQESRQGIEGQSFLPYETDAWGQLQDGYDAVEWLSKSEYTNGKIGTAGASAMGMRQLLLAPTAPPSLKCQYVHIASPSLYHNTVFAGGQFRKNQVEGWLGTYWKDPRLIAYIKTLYEYSDFWKSYNVLEVTDRIKAPVVHAGGWYDIFLQGTIDAYENIQSHGAVGARGKQKLVIGPWTHDRHSKVDFGDFQLPENARTFPESYSEVRWFEHHLLGKDHGFDHLPSVTYYVMGSMDGSAKSGNRWKSASSWPVPSKDYQLYLTDNQTLSRRCVSKNTTGIRFTYDPENPVPTIGGKNLFLAAGPKDQSSIEQRDDVVVFTSQPLKKEQEFTGRVKATIFVSSDQVDTDVSVRLTDVYPDGRSILICEGHRRLMTVPEWKADPTRTNPVEVEVDLWSTSMVVGKGHRLRVAITSSNYPAYDINKNIFATDQGAHKVAQNCIAIGKQYPSRVTLPLVQPIERQSAQ